LLLGVSAWADDGSETVALPTVVTATRVSQTVSEVPAAVDVVSGAQIREAGPLVNLSEALARVPGLVVLNRQNMAQDLQISSRGFGARSTFGVRGVRLYEDGIPLTMPDGQGQSASFDLADARRIEVLRGPASALYGNASGGVVQLFTQDGPPVPEVMLGQAYSRDGLSKTTVKAAGQLDGTAYEFDASQTHTDGYRDHSAASRQQLHTRWHWALDGRSTFTLVGSYLDMPGVQDPLGLTAAQWAANPQQAGTNAVAYNTRKDIANAQLGGIYERHLGEDSWRLMVYGGTRRVTQYQAIPVSVQTANAAVDAAYPGGVIDLNRHFSGLDTRYTWRGRLWQQPWQLTAGLSLDQLAEHRSGFQNFDAQGELGVEGALRRNEDNTANNRDQYLLGQWDASAAWQLSAGMRHSRVSLASRDHYVVPGNGDDSGRMDFEATTPTVGVLWRIRPLLHLYATAGESVETPTLNEVAYRSTSGTATGWNTNLKASQGQHLEVGAKAGMGTDWFATLALFQVHTDDEIAVDSNLAGRTTYQNVGRTDRHGLEAAWQWQPAVAWQVDASAAWTDAQYLSAFTSHAVGGVATRVSAGQALPGVPRRTAFAEAVWRPAPQGWHAALEWRHSGRIWANDLNDAYAPSYQLWAVRTGWRRQWTDWRLDLLARIDNLGNAHTIGSVIVNESNRRYFEPAPGRSATLAAYLTRHF
jgi:iron complex outermembrane receptor protein